MLKPAIHPDPRIVAVLLVTCFFTTALGVAHADAASVAYKKGKAYLADRNAPEALAHLEYAYKLKPNSERYRNALFEARDLYLDYGANLAPTLGPKGYSLLVSLANRCQEIDPDDGRTLSVLRELGKQRSTLLSRLEQAMAAATSGATETAKRLLAPALPLEEHFNQVPRIREEIRYQEQLFNIRSLRDSGAFERAFSELDSALFQRPGASNTLTLKDELTSDYLESLRLSLAPYLESSRLSDLAAGLALVRKAEATCPQCKARIEGAETIRERYKKGVEQHLRMLSLAKSPSASWVRCRVLDEASGVLGESQWPEHDGHCDSEQGRLNVSIVTNGPVECGNPSFDAIIYSVFPGGIRYVQPTSLSPHSGGSTDLGIEIELLNCDSGSLGERNVKTRSSVYTAGIQQIVNSEYVELERRLSAAERELSRIQAHAQAEPGNYGYSLALIATSFSVGSLRTKLRNTPAFLELPVEVPYTFESFEAGAGARIEAVVRLIDPTNPEIHLETEVVGSAVRWADGVRGVALTDSVGESNRDPALPSPKELTAAALKEFSTDLRDKAGPLVGTWLASRASLALKDGREAEALGHLLRLKSLEIGSGPPALLALQSELPATALLSRDDMMLQKAALGNIEATARRTATRPSQTVTSGPRAVAGNEIERSMRAVVVVERGGSLGSGFFISADGLLLTNFHVIDDRGPIAVTTDDGEQYLATVVREDKSGDLALLRIQGRAPHFLKLASPSEISLGIDLFALGSPHGLQGTVTKGVLSAKRKVGNVDYLQIDVPINPGNSGGPLLLPDGRVVGINTFGLKDAESLNFAVSVERARSSFGSVIPR